MDAVKSSPGRLVRACWRGLWPVLAVILTVTAFRSAVADWNDVPSGSMKPTILEGDRIVVDKLAYDLRLPFTRVRLAWWDTPARGDIVILLSPADHTRLVKRVVGLPGDVIAMRDNRLIVNRRPVDLGHVVRLAGADPRPLLATERLGRSDHEVMITPGLPSPRSFGPLIVPPRRYFVMGDNRDRSLDSRSFGFVPRSLILGRAIAVAASLDPAHRFAPRWDRFGRPLN